MGGTYQRVARCYHHGAAVYSQEGGGRQAGQVSSPRMVFPGARAVAATLYLGEEGRWQMANSQATYTSEGLACSALNNTSGAWREEVVGVVGSRLVTVVMRLPKSWPLYFHVTGAPLDTVGYYARTDLQMGTTGSEAPVYTKPGQGSSKLYLFPYKGSWVVGPDPFAGPNTMQFRMFQVTRPPPNPLSRTAAAACCPWRACPGLSRPTPGS